MPRHAKADEVKPLAREQQARQAPGMNSHDRPFEGPTGKPSQAEGEDPGASPQDEPLPAEGHPSQAEGEDPDD